MTLEIAHYPILAQADTPQQLRELSQDKLQQLSVELRQYLLTSVSQSSGHFASGLGTVELTVALHYVYNKPIPTKYSQVAVNVCQPFVKKAAYILSHGPQKVNMTLLL